MTRTTAYCLFFCPAIILGLCLGNAQVTLGQEHSDHGPHGGDVLEIGKHEYHAELVLDEGQNQVVLYLWDRVLKANVAIDAPHLNVNLIAKGKPVQIALKPTPQPADPKGLASRFTVVSPDLMQALHLPKSEARLSLRIGNRAYVVKLAHNHDHAGHAHAKTTPSGSKSAAQSSSTLPKKR